MNIIKKFCFVILLSPLFLPLYAQKVEGKVMASTSDEATVILRWLLSEGKFPKEGVYIYRKEEGDKEWIKLTPRPIKKADRDKARTILGDSTFAIWESMIFEKPQEEHDIEMWEFLLLCQALKEPRFAEVFGLHYEDTTAILGRTYRYKVTLVKKRREILIGVSNPVTVKRYEQASPPLNFEGVAGDGEAKFKWKREERFFIFNLYRSKARSGPYKLINKAPIFIFETKDTLGQFRAPEFFFTDTNLVNGHTYWYKLSGIDVFGRESKLTPPIRIVPKDLTPPPPPKELKTKVENNKVFLSWSPPKAKDLKGYEVYRSMTRYKGPYEKVNSDLVLPTDTLFIDEVPKVGKVYYYYLTAIDSSLNKSKSLIVIADVVDRIPPQKPQHLSAKGDTGRVILSWEKNKEPDIMGYMIYRSIKKDKDKFVLLTPKPVSGARFIDSLPKVARNDFFYKIRAVDSSYNQSEYSDIIKVRMPDIVPPSSPILKKITVKKGIASLEWFRNPEKDILGYNVLRCESGDTAKWVVLTKNLLSPSITHYSDTLPKPLVRYFYTVVAIDSSGNVSKKAKPLVCMVSDRVPPSPPEVVKVSYDKKKNEVTIIWRIKKESDLRGCIVFRKEEEKTFYPISPLLTTDSFIDKFVESGKIYYYKIRAYDKVGNVSESSKVVKVETSK